MANNEISISNSPTNSQPNSRTNSPSNFQEIELTPQPEPENSLFSNCKNQLKELIKDLNINTTTLHLIIKYTMELVEKTPLKGPEQKDFACRLLREIFQETTDGDEEKTLLLLVDNGSIGNMIDLIIDATQGKLDINTITQVSQGCIGACLPYLFKIISETLKKRREK